VTLTIDFQDPRGVATNFATHVLIQFTGQEYFLTFYEVRLPITIGDDSSQLDQLAQLGSIEATAMARIAMPAQRLYEALPVINEFVAKQLEQQKRNADKAQATKDSTPTRPNAPQTHQTPRKGARKR
jgi:hypothetical protein